MRDERRQGVSQLTHDQRVTQIRMEVLHEEDMLGREPRHLRHQQLRGRSFVRVATRWRLQSLRDGPRHQTAFQFQNQLCQFPLPPVLFPCLEKQQRVSGLNTGTKIGEYGFGVHGG